MNKQRWTGTENDEFAENIIRFVEKIKKAKKSSAYELGPHIERWKEIKLKLKAATTNTEITKPIHLYCLSSNFDQVYRIPSAFDTS